MWIQLALTGLLVALLPLSLVWVSRDRNKYRKLVAVTLFLTFDLIMFGAFTRLTDSGLGCPDWPGCYAQANPLQAHAEISAAEAAQPHGPVTLKKAWVEMLHRYLAMSVGVLIVAQTVIAWRQRKRLPGSPWLPTVLLLWVCLQGAFGAWTVTLKLQPMIVTIHLLLGIGLLALLAVLLEQQRALLAPAADGAGRLVLPATLALLLVLIQVALGGWVSTNYAALACHDYPLCNGEFLPPMDFRHGYSLWRQLGQTADGGFLPFPALVAIQWVHRNFALLVVAVVAWLGWRVSRLAGLETLGRQLLALIVLQFLLGISTVFFSWPLLLAVLHNGGAALLVLLLTMLNYRLRVRPGAVH